MEMSTERKHQLNQMLLNSGLCLIFFFISSFLNRHLYDDVILKYLPDILFGIPLILVLILNLVVWAIPVWVNFRKKTGPKLLNVAIVCGIYTYGFFVPFNLYGILAPSILLIGIIALERYFSIKKFIVTVYALITAALALGLAYLNADFPVYFSCLTALMVVFLYHFMTVTDEKLSTKRFVFEFILASIVLGFVFPNLVIQ